MVKPYVTRVIHNHNTFFYITVLHIKVKTVDNLSPDIRLRYHATGGRSIEINVVETTL